MLVVRGDGRYVRWLSLPRPVVIAVMAAVSLAVLANAAALVHYATIYHDRQALATANDVLARQASLVPPMRQRLLQVRDEMRAWEALHVEVNAQLGGTHRAALGLGGATRVAWMGARGLDDIDVLLAYVREESQRLRMLARTTHETRGLIAASVPSRLPMRTALNSAFGPRLSPWTGEPEFHSGVDLAAPLGTPVKATAAGVVRFAGLAAGYGQSVLVDHGGGMQSRYGHLQKVSVKVGERVDRGQVLGLSGNSGRSTGPHLHYEVLANGRPIDPRRLARD